MSMSMRCSAIGAAVLSGAVLLTPVFLQAQGAAEVFTATASVKTAAGATATAPLELAITRKMPQGQAETLVNAFKTGGAAAFKKALAGVAPTGTVQIGTAAKVPTRLTIERVTGVGRLLTVVTDQPLLFLGASLPGAKATAGYDFAVIDIEIDAKGSGSGTLAPAAKLRVNQQGALVVDDYGVEAVRLLSVKKTK